jgi:hypothetical protein
MPVVSGEPGARARPVRFFVAREDIAAYENLRSLGVSGDFGPDGLLRICGLSPGTYVLAALGPQEGRMPSTYSSMTFVVSDRDVGGIRITANPLLSISGEAVWESTPPDVEQPPELTVRIARQAGTVWDASATSVPGTFSLRVPSGVHSSLEISGVTSPFYVRDVTYDGRSILRSSLTTSPNGRLRIILGRDAASLRVLATDALGEAVEHATVLVLSADAPSESALATAMVAGTTDADGAYVVSGLPPGRYYVLATDNPPPVLYGPYPSPRVYIEKTPETLARLLAIRSQGTLVELSPDSTSAITVSLRNIR